MKIYEELLNIEHDDLSGKVFPPLVVLGYLNEKRSERWYYVRCEICSLDPDLYKTGVFLVNKAQLLKGGLPCGCSGAPRWNEWQYRIIIQRVCSSQEFNFIGWSGPFKGRLTKCTLECKIHGRWSTTNINLVMHRGPSCPGCSEVNRDQIMITSFTDTDFYHKDTKFWRSSRLDKHGNKNFWFYTCGDCFVTGEARYSAIQKGYIVCGCSSDYSRQVYTYINIIKDGDLEVAVKYGIANNPLARSKTQEQKSCYDLIHYGTWEYQTRMEALNAEKDCKSMLTSGILPKTDFPDGYTETTYIYNIDTIIKIYEDNGGTKVEK